MKDIFEKDLFGAMVSPEEPGYDQLISVIFDTMKTAAEMNAKGWLSPDAVLKANLQKLKQTLASDKELAEYADLFLRKNAERLFTADAAPGNIPTESSPPAS